MSIRPPDFCNAMPGRLRLILLPKAIYNPSSMPHHSLHSEHFDSQQIEVALTRCLLPWHDRLVGCFVLLHERSPRHFRR